MKVTWRTPPKIAAEMGVEPGKILALIASGELIAINCAEKPHGRPRWKIRPADFEAFLERRKSRPPAPTTRRRRKSPALANLIEFV